MKREGGLRLKERETARRGEISRGWETDGDENEERKKDRRDREERESAEGGT